MYFRADEVRGGICVAMVFLLQPVQTMASYFGNVIVQGGRSFAQNIARRVQCAHSFVQITARRVCLSCKEFCLHSAPACRALQP